MATLSRTLIRRLIRMGSYLFLAAIVAFTSFIGFGRKDKHTLDYSLSNNVNVAHADTPHNGDIGGADADGGGDSGADGGGDSDGDMGCFAKGTPVRMADGTEMPIEQIGPGMKVLSFDVETGGHTASVVERLFVHDGVTDSQAKFDVHPLLRVTIANATEQRIVEVTSNHPYLTESGKYVAIGDIEVGTVVLGTSGPMRIEQKDVLKDSGVGVTYNLHLTEEPHNYFAAGVVVHNVK